MRLDNKIAVVTGAGSGFGEGIAKRFAAEGARVVVNDLREDAAGRVADEIAATGAKALAVVADVSKGEDVKRLVSSAVLELGGLDIMVNNAGVPQRNRPMLEIDEETFDRIFAVNVKSIYHAAVHALPVFRTRGGGVMINTASTAALRPRPGLAWYNASKGAVTTLTKSMAVELAPDNVRVNALCPVIGDTGMVAEFMGGDDTPEIREKFRQSVPLGRFSTPEDVAAAALYLASDEAAFITGVCLEIDGGRCI